MRGNSVSWHDVLDLVLEVIRLQKRLQRLANLRIEHGPSNIPTIKGARVIVGCPDVDVEDVAGRNAAFLSVILANIDACRHSACARLGWRRVIHDDENGGWINCCVGAWNKQQRTE